MADNTRRDDGYDPYEHREDVQQPTNYFETLMNMVKGSLGTGILAMPYAFKFSGTLIGVIVCVVIGALAVIGLRMLVIAEYLVCKKKQVPHLHFTDAIEAAMEYGPECFKNKAYLARSLVFTFTMINQYGICCVYVLFVATTIKQVGDTHFGQFAVEYYILALLLPLIIINLIPNLKAIAKVSFISLILSFFVYFSVLYYIFREQLPPISKRSTFGCPIEYPLFVGTYLFSLEAPALVMMISHKSAKPSRFTRFYGELNLSVLLCITVYAAIGFCGYWKYGAAVHSAIILNFPKKETLSQVVLIAYSVAIFLSYVLHCYVSVQIIWEEIVKKRVEGMEHQFLYIFLIRLFSVIFTVVLAAAVPFLGLVISLVGSCSLPFLGFIFPAMMDFCIKYPENKANGKCGICLDILLVIFGIVAFFIGSGCAIYEIVLKSLSRK